MKTADIIQLSFDGVVNSGDGYMYRDAKRLCIYLALFIDPERDSCFYLSFTFRLPKMSQLRDATLTPSAKQ